MRQTKKSAIELLFVLGLFGIYTIISLFVAVIGADVYRGNVEESEANYNMRTSVLYLTEKVRQNQVVEGIRIDVVGDSQALVLSEEINDKIYETWIYIEDGQLSEVLVPADTMIVPGIGQSIMPLSTLTFSQEENLLHIAVTDLAGNIHATDLLLNCVSEEGLA